MIPRPRAERRALERSTTRTNAVADALGFVAEQDAEIPTTFRLYSPAAPDDVTLCMGSPALVAGLFEKEKLIDWMTLEGKGPKGLPAGVNVRTPVRTVFEWRDGLPGEAPTLVTPGGVELVIENEAGSAFDNEALAEWVDSFPKGIWLVLMSASALELRAHAPATDDAVHCAQSLLGLASSLPRLSARKHGD
ncbi:hypothetical protein [Polyangium fumosum]|uniref:Uncharacterized protein n=1 Tax=Polyangium fumosum TaxID=889272 RepID=A0A4U1JCK4_9BACT|nr:hypothetical protein [Polyangium fumosum]TKD06573.1 hypothetical protein E8A74_18875 [Polyangium fumosum]